MRHTIRLLGPIQRNHACKVIDSAPEGWVVTIGPETRSQEQNRKLWPMLTDMAEQGSLNGVRYSKEDWKVFFVSGLKKEVPVVGLNGEPVNLSMKTSTMTRKEFSNLIEYIYSEGTQMGVIFSDPALATYEEYKHD